MSNVRPFPSRKDRRFEEAADWVAALERGLSKDEEQKLVTWIAKDAANKAALMELAKLWDQLESLSRLSDIFPEPATKSRFGWDMRMLATAVSVFAAIVLFTYVQYFDGERPMGERSSIDLNASVFETNIGEQATHQLPDGTVLILNTNSRVRVDYSTDNRLLTLDRGEVHVKVAHDPSRRLSVLIGDRVVQAVGTEFNLEITDDQSIELVVTEGVVLVGVVNTSISEIPANGPVLLTQSSSIVGAGEEAVISSDDSLVDALNAERIESDEIAVRLSWREGNLIFMGESLEEAVAEVGRYTAVEFVFVDEQAKKVRVAGLFQAGDVDGLLAALRNHFHIAHEWQGDDKILLSVEE